MSKIKILSLFLFFSLSGMVLTGCKANSIKFVRESKIHDLFEQTQQQQEQNTRKSQVSKSSGVVIYKSNDIHVDRGAANVNFGPSDLNFNLKY